MTAPGNDGDTGQDTPAGEITIDYGGKVTGDAPTTLTLDEPVTVTYAASVEKATVTVDDDDPETEAWTKQLKFGPAEAEKINAEVTQDPENDRKVVVKVAEWPGDVEKLAIEWGGEAYADSTGGDDPDGEDQDDGSGNQPGAEKQDPPAEITKANPEVTAVYANKVTKATITIDDEDDATDPFTKVIKFSPAAPEEPGDGDTPPEDGDPEQPEDPEQPPEDDKPEDPEQPPEEPGDEQPEDPETPPEDDPEQPPDEENPEEPGGDEDVPPEDMPEPQPEEPGDGDTPPEDGEDGTGEQPDDGAGGGA